MGKRQPGRFKSDRGVEFPFPLSYVEENETEKDRFHMSLSSRDLVTRALRFQHPGRVPRDLWTLPWAETHYPDELRRLLERFPPDFVQAPTVYSPSARVRGDAYTPGEFTDEWGCTFVNIQAGAIGEVREPMLAEIDGWKSVRPPYEVLPSNVSGARDRVNRFCEGTDRFVLSDCCPRPWERYQFLRGSANALMDVAAVDEGVLELLGAVHGYYMKELEFWVSTSVDGVKFMDDWGAQRHLLISPRRWRELFKPLYKEYCDLAHAHGKFIFMHSDGHILDIYPDLVEIGLDAVNSQLFCMDLRALAESVKGKITFWGEIDRQHVLPSPDPGLGRAAVREVAKHLYDSSGGVIAQLEFGLAANPATVEAIFDEWEQIPGRMEGAEGSRA
jgi:uroporphyrinogen decarboxylase